MADLQVLGQLQGLNSNASAIVKAIASAFVGNAAVVTFTMAAAATKTVSSSTVLAGSAIILIDTNAAAATLQGSAKRLYPSAIVPGTSFTVSTASGGNAVGTETFIALVVNVA
jgi:hypothetical protein